MIKTLQQNYSKSQPKARDARDVANIGFKRSELTLELSARLKMIADASGSEKAIYNSAKLAKCGSLSNIYTGKDMHNSDGEAFDGLGHLYSCNLAYCQNCVSLKARLHRRKVRDTLKRLKPLVGTNWNFVTLTAPSVPVPLLESIEVYLRAWNLFRQRKWFIESVRAGWKAIEFTVSKSTGLVHVHIHALMLSKFLRPSDVRAQWQDCITKAWRDDWKGRRARRVNLVFPASGAVIDVRPITARNHNAIETAILEVCKYAGKGSAWLALSDSDLLAVSELKRFNRLFESFGESYGKLNLESERDIRLDTHNLTAGEKLKTTKPKATNDLSTLNLKVNVTRTFRKAQLIARYPVAVFRTLDGRDFLPSEPLISEPLRLIKSTTETKPMKLPAILLDETSDINRLTDELGYIPSQLKEAARRNDETALVVLSDRKVQLPELIQKAKMKDFAERLSVARSRVAAYDTELQSAARESGTLANEVETKVPILQAEIERLRRESAQAHHERESLQFAAKQARDDLARIQNQRESLLLEHFGTD
jgi:hypothetical protein